MSPLRRALGEGVLVARLGPRRTWWIAVALAVLTGAFALSLALVIMGSFEVRVAGLALSISHPLRFASVALAALGVVWLSIEVALATRRRAIVLAALAFVAGQLPLLYYLATDGERLNREVLTTSPEQLVKAVIHELTGHSIEGARSAAIVGCIALAGGVARALQFPTRSGRHRRTSHE